MNRILLLFLISFLTVSVSGQENDNELHFKLLDTNYTWRKTSKTVIDSFYHELDAVKNSTNKIHIRFYLKGQIVDLFRVDSINYGGVLTNKIAEYVYEKNKDSEYEHSIPYQVVFEKIHLDKRIVKEVLEELVSSGQIELPTDSLIRNWHKLFFHCDNIYLESKVNDKFNAQNYICPWRQNDSIVAKGIVIKNYDLIKNSFSLDSLYIEFQSKLPSGKTYSSDGYMMLYRMTDLQMDAREKTKPKRMYMKSVKDTVDNFINAKLDTNQAELNSISCNESYQLVIAKNGKIKKVSISDYDKPKFKNSFGLIDFFADKKEIRKCKLKVKEIFNSIHLGFLNLEYELYRTVMFTSNDKVILIDDTIY